MLAWLGLATILSFLLLIVTKRMSVITGLVLLPLIFASIAGFTPAELGEMALAGLKQVAPTGILLMFAVLYFATMLDAGLFDPLIQFILRKVQGDPRKVVLGTAILTMIVHLDGDGTATFMIVLSAFLPIYKQLNISRLTLTTVVALGVGPLHLVPWSGTSARALATLKTEVNQLFNPNLPAILGGVVWVLLAAYLLGSKEKQRLGLTEMQADGPFNSLNALQQKLRRPRLIWVNVTLTVGLIMLLMLGWFPTPVLFVVAAMLALWVNYPHLADQQAVVKGHAANIFLVSSMIFAAGIFSGLLTGTKMIDHMATALVQLIPAQYGTWLPVITAITSMPASLIFTPDAYYFGVLPILTESAVQMQVNPLEIGRAALLGQMTVGFPISPLTASTFLLIGLAEVDLGDHQRSTFLWSWGTTAVMTLVALLTGSISWP